MHSFHRALPRIPLSFQSHPDSPLPLFSHRSNPSLHFLPLPPILVYGFYDECKRRCNIKIWKTFIDVFNCLPITALVAGKIFCVHGGLSPSLSTMDDIRRISRPTDVPDYGLLNDLLWSDPSDTALDWEDNERGVSYCFGKSVIQDFLAKYDFDLICRAHMVVEDGYEVSVRPALLNQPRHRTRHLGIRRLMDGARFSALDGDYPIQFWNERTLVTIFSAPNYCGGEWTECASIVFELLTFQTSYEFRIAEQATDACGRFSPPNHPILSPCSLCRSTIRPPWAAATQNSITLVQ